MWIKKAISYKFTHGETVHRPRTFARPETPVCQHYHSFYNQRVISAVWIVAKDNEL